MKNTFQRFCLVLSRNQRFQILYCVNEEDFENWSKALKKSTLVTGYNKVYTSQKVIAKGTNAKVCLAKQLKTGKEFAVKTFEKKHISSSKNSDKLKKAIQNEYSIMRLTNHPNIVKFLEAYEGDNHIYLVSENLKGGELLERILQKGNFIERDASAIFAQLLRSLVYLHSMGIMHRDVKPENLVFKDSNSFDIVLTDFGLAEFELNSDRIYKRCGTPGYVAPEILNDEEYGCKADIYSAGIILYIL